MLFDSRQVSGGATEIAGPLRETLLGQGYHFYMKLVHLIKARTTMLISDKIFNVIYVRAGSLAEDPAFLSFKV